MADKIDKNSESSIKKAAEVLNSVELVSCDTLVPSNNDGSYAPSDSVNVGRYNSSNFNCGGDFDYKMACSEAQIGKYVYGSDHKPLTKDGKYVLITKDNYHSKCTPSVAHFLDKGLRKGWKTKSGDGYEMRIYLPLHGFKCITPNNKENNTRPKMKIWTETYAAPGDVCVMTRGDIENPVNGKYLSSNCGHATMFNGEYWVSDTVQVSAGALCYSAPTYYAVEVYRFQDCIVSQSTKTEDIKAEDNTKTATSEQNGAKKDIKIGFLGDGYFKDGYLPKEVIRVLGINSSCMKYYGLSSATSLHYMNKERAFNGAKTPYTNMKSNYADDAYKDMKTFKPKYLIIMLGYGDAKRKEGGNYATLLGQIGADFPSATTKLITIHEPLHNVTEKELQSVYGTIPSTVNLKGEKFKSLDKTTLTNLGAKIGNTLKNIVT